MSRVGRMPIDIPAGVNVNLDGHVITVKGPKGELTRTLHQDMKITVADNVITVERPSDDKNHRALHGLTRALIANMVKGVSEGFKKELEIVGVGYRVAKEGKRIVLNVGHSHPIYFNEDDKVTFDVPDSNTIIVKSFDKQYCGQIAANIRAKRPPEPYHGKGIKYSDERIRRKAGKTGK